MKLTILGDTSYGSCCVDEIAAEHVDADAVVHYGRACLSPTARLPVLHIFTRMELDHEVVMDFIRRHFPDMDAKVILTADVSYAHHVRPISQLLESAGYTNKFAASIIHDPSSSIPNRTVPDAVKADLELVRVAPGPHLGPTDFSPADTDISHVEHQDLPHGLGYPIIHSHRPTNANAPPPALRPRDLSNDHINLGHPDQHALRQELPINPHPHPAPDRRSRQEILPPGRGQTQRGQDRQFLRDWRLGRHRLLGEQPDRLQGVLQADNHAVRVGVGAQEGR